MPLLNSYNKGIKDKVNQININKINHENKLNHVTGGDEMTPLKLTTPLESMVERIKDVHGGSGYAAAATHQDLGFEKMKVDKPRQPRKRIIIPPTDGQAIASGVSAAGVSAAGVSAAGVSAAGRRRGGNKELPLLGTSKIKTKRGGAKLGLSDLAVMKGEIETTPAMMAKETVKAKPQAEQTKPVPVAQMPAVRVGAGASKRKPNERNDIVKKIMKEKGLKMIEASKYVKENGLYKPK